MIGVYPANCQDCDEAGETMDVETVDHEFAQLQQEGQQVGEAIEGLATKMKAAGDGGDATAKDWMLDLKGIALQIQQEQLQVQALLQALHDYANNNSVQQAPPGSQASLQATSGQPQGAGIRHSFFGGNFGQAMTQGMGMGAGFGIADSLISSLFN
jgi:hypothetical protein